MAGEFLDLLFSFHPNDPDLRANLVYNSRARQFVDRLSKVPAQKFVKEADTDQDPLELLDPQVNTIAYIFTLQARIIYAGDSPQSARQIPEAHRPGGAIWNKIARFLEIADPVQLRYVGTEWRRLVEYVEVVARLVGSPALAISPIRNALTQLDPTTGTFTNTHLSFMRLCMEARAYAPALSILDNYIHSLPSKIESKVASLEYSVPAAEHTNSGDYITQKSAHSGTITLQAVQEYYVLGAMAYAGMRQFKDAKDFLEHVLVMPSTNGACTGLFVEAYQKWVLLSLLVDGSAGQEKLPRTVSNAAINTAKAVSKAYEALAEAFVDLNNMPKLKVQVREGRDIWADDGNSGLVHELIESQLSFAIKRLSRTYSAIPVSNVAANLGADVNELTPYLARLIEERRLNAELSDTGKADVGVVLRFFLDPTQGPLAKTEIQQQKALLEQTRRTTTLMEQVKSANSRLELTKEIIDNHKRVNKKMPSSGDTMDTSWDDDSGLLEDFDEDVMGDAH